MANVDPFNSSVELGLRAATILEAIFPRKASLSRLVIYDYLCVHSSDIEEGPESLHPDTPYRSGEILVRRGPLRQGLQLFYSRSLVTTRYQKAGIYYSANDYTGVFLDACDGVYLAALRDRASWVDRRFKTLNDRQLRAYAKRHLGDWGAEFEMATDADWELWAQ
ncbi:hypothetical protein MalM25_08320 [Planctomycetes bacterium MalM25]|nr:hypothetical protein MalM25_08320 [Planctomycetes bacterium MalM25]